MEWLKATSIAVVILVVALGSFIGVRIFLSGGEEDTAKAMAQSKAQIATAKTLLTKSSNSDGNAGQLAALTLLRQSGEKSLELSLGCIDGSGKRSNQACVLLSKIDLSPNKDRELTPFILSKSKLSGANFLAANLSWVEFKNADLRGAKLDTTRLYRTNFEGADLSNANFNGADLLYTELLNANLSGANMAAVKNLRQARLDRACLSNPRQPPLNLPAGLKPPTKKCR